MSEEVVQKLSVAHPIHQSNQHQQNQDASQMAAVSVLSFAGPAAAAILQTFLLLFEFRRSARVQYNRAYEQKFRALRWARTLTYAALCVCQVCIVVIYCR